MSTIGLVFTGVGLAMDAAAVCMSKGIVFKKFNTSITLRLALTFGIFQALMIVIGTFIGGYFSSIIDKYNTIIVVAVFLVLGIKMLVEAIKENEEELENEVKSIDYKELLSLGLATSLDALAVGVTFASSGSSRILPPAIIGIVTFLVSVLAVIVGFLMGKKIKEKYAEIIGALILIALGLVKLF